MPFGIHPHMLRHSAGFKLANQGVDTRSLQHYLGHKNIQHTVRYSELSHERFRNFWKDQERLADTRWPSFRNVTASSATSTVVAAGHGSD
jgi:integrase